jgi:Fe-S-cluster-containing hydrogenase component 2
MALYVTDECICCSACEPECPTGAISMRDDNCQAQIAVAACDECADSTVGPRCQAVCPIECILPKRAA